LRGWILSKLDGEIMAITSKRFFGYQMPAPKEVDAAIAGFCLLC
jgi:hypothetical protein